MPDQLPDIEGSAGPVEAQYVLSADVNSEYVHVAASQTDEVLGASGAAGDFLRGLLAVPASTSPGAISIKDGDGSAMTVFEGGAESIGSLHPFPIPLEIISANGAWQVTTGADISVLVVGNFTS